MQIPAADPESARGRGVDVRGVAVCTLNQTHTPESGILLNPAVQTLPDSHLFIKP